MRLREILPITEWFGSYSLTRLGPDGVAALVSGQHCVFLFRFRLDGLQDGRRLYIASREVEELVERVIRQAERRHGR